MTFIVTLVYGVYALSLLDPFSIFGRFMTFFAKPVVLYLNNFAANNLARIDNYTLDHTVVTFFEPVAYAIPAAFLLLIWGMSLAKGRLYCNMICPVGTLLGLISKVSLFRIRIDNESCTRCGRCAIRCKSSCIDFLHSKVDITRCVDCFDCVYTCQDRAITYGITGSLFKKHTFDENRRKNIITGAMFLLGISHVASSQDKIKPVPKRESTIKENRTSFVAPPGAGSIKRFNELCTACSICIAACPSGVLQPSLKQYGVIGLLQPVMDYHKSFCQFNCTVCTDICPTNALFPLMPEAKKLTQLGKAVFIADNCIVKTEKTACGACSESCPTKAVFLIPFERNLFIPKVNTEVCIGCGQCEFSCPTRPYKAIFVDGNTVHEAARKPEISAPALKPHEEFPF
jgi:ferredoxin